MTQPGTASPPCRLKPLAPAQVPGQYPARYAALPLCGRASRPAWL